MGKPPSDAKSATIHHFSHPCALNLTCLQSEAALVSPTCSCCKKTVDSWAYACEYCKFFLHTGCSSLPTLVNHQLHPAHNLTLTLNAKESYDCAACGESGEGFSYNCPPCSLSLHTACSVMPAKLFSPCHHHQLALMANAPYPTMTFMCDLCGTVGSRWLYRCNCGFDAHLKCAKEAIAPPMQPCGNSHHGYSTNMVGNSGHMVAPSIPVINNGYSAALGQYPMGTGYLPATQVTPAAMQMQMQMQMMQRGAYNGPVMHPVASPAMFQAQPVASPALFQAQPVAGPALFQAQPVAGPAPFQAQPVAGPALFQAQPAQYTVLQPQVSNASAGVNQQKGGGNALANQIVKSAASGVTLGILGALFS